MQAVQVQAYGDAGVLQYTATAERPRPGAGDAVVRIHVAGVNYLDVQYRTGRVKAPGLPFTPGSEGAGVVTEVGGSVTDVKPGDRVAYAMVLGSYAEYAVVPASRLVVLPPHVDFEAAAAVMLQGMTAHYLTHSTVALTPADTVLVHAAAGGVGALIVQAAKICGARVIGTAGTDAKAAVAREAGADEVIVYTRDPFDEAARALTGGRGVDVVYDAVGRDTFEGSLNCLRPRGLLALFGFASGPVPPFDPAILGLKGSLFLTRPGLNQYIATREELLARAQAIFDWLERGRLRLRVDRVFPLADAATAHRELEGRRTTGKLLLAV